MVKKASYKPEFQKRILIMHKSGKIISEICENYWQISKNSSKFSIITQKAQNN